MNILFLVLNKWNFRSLVDLYSYFYPFSWCYVLKVNFLFSLFHQMVEIWFPPFISQPSSFPFLLTFSLRFLFYLWGPLDVSKEGVISFQEPERVYFLQTLLLHDHPLPDCSTSIKLLFLSNSSPLFTSFATLLRMYQTPWQ